MSKLENPLIKKLNLGKFNRIVRYNLSDDSPELNDLVTEDALVQDYESYDVIFVHVYHLEEMSQVLLDCWHHHRIKENGLLYLVYPKLKNNKYPGIHRDDIFPALGVEDALGLMPGTHYKFNKMVSLNDTFTIIGIKHLPEKEVNKLIDGNKIKSPSGRVQDYIQYLPEISSQLSEVDPRYATIFQSLTPGRQRNWAREIYSAKTLPTKQKRFDKLIDEISQQLSRMDESAPI